MQHKPRVRYYGVGAFTQEEEKPKVAVLEQQQHKYKGDVTPERLAKALLRRVKSFSEEKIKKPVVRDTKPETTAQTR